MTRCADCGQAAPLRHAPNAPYRCPPCYLARQDKNRADWIARGIDPDHATAAQYAAALADGK